MFEDLLYYLSHLYSLPCEVLSIIYKQVVFHRLSWYHIHYHRFGATTKHV